jgi:hypothetical protein
VAWIQWKLVMTVNNSASASDAARAALSLSSFRDHKERNTSNTSVPPPQESSQSYQLLPLPISVSTPQFYYDSESADKLLSNLPQWIQDYVKWHAQMRQQFPGMKLMTHPKAPPILLRTCLGICGGLHDRLGQLPWDLYLANATGRVLLLAWQRPQPLESFLIPNFPKLLDWRVPLDFHTGFHDMHRVRNFTELFDGMPEDHPNDDFWNTMIDQAIERATIGEFKTIKVLRHRILGHLGEGPLQDRLDQEIGIGGRADMVHSAPHFGRIFWLFFRPSEPIEQWMKKIMEEGNLIPQHYSAVHCRVRHPKAISSRHRLTGKNPRYPPDKTGLPWEGESKDFAIHMATTALQCSSTILSQKSHSTTTSDPIYFLADSNDLVRHVVWELNPHINPSIVPLVQNNSLESSGVDPAFYHLIQSLNIKARDVSQETTHLDLQKGRPAFAYYATFVDLLLVVHAQCVIYGVGYYASFGAKLSGTPCQYLYQQEAWGHQAPKSAQVCPTPRNKTTSTQQKKWDMQHP